MKLSILIFSVLSFIVFLSSCEQQELDLTNPEDQKKLAKSFVNNFNQARPIDPISADDITEEQAYQIADYFIEEQLRFRGNIAGYKVGSFSKGQYDNGPVDGLSGPVTAAMFEKGIHQSGAHISFDCCHMTFV